MAGIEEEDYPEVNLSRVDWRRVDTDGPEIVEAASVAADHIRYLVLRTGKTRDDAIAETEVWLNNQFGIPYYYVGFAMIEAESMINWRPPSASD